MKNNIFNIKIPELRSRVTLEFSNKEYSKVRKPEEQDYFIHIFSKSKKLNEEILSYVEDVLEFFYYKKDKGKTADRHYKIKIRSLNTYIRNEEKQPLVLNNLIVIFEELQKSINAQLENKSPAKEEPVPDPMVSEEVSEVEHINLEDMIKVKKTEKATPPPKKVEPQPVVNVKPKKEPVIFMDDEEVEIAQIRQNIRKELNTPDFEDFGDEMPELPLTMPEESKKEKGMNVQSIPYDGEVDGEALMASLLNEAGYNKKSEDNEDDTYYR